MAMAIGNTFKYQEGIGIGLSWSYSLDVYSLLHWPTIIMNISTYDYITIGLQLVDLQALLHCVLTRSNLL